MPKVDVNNCTILLPVANNFDLSKECIDNLVNVYPGEIIVFYDYGTPEDYIIHERVNYVKNPGCRGLSAIWNQCIMVCPTEYLILCSWRERPTFENIQTLFDNLNNGFAFVALNELHFFGFSKHLTTVIGFFDSGFTTGQMEDTDFFNRCCMEDLAMYISDEVREVSYPSTWLANPTPNVDYYRSKWEESPPLLKMKHLELNLENRLIYKGLFEDRTYKSFAESELKLHHIWSYYNNIFTQRIRIC